MPSVPTYGARCLQPSHGDDGAHAPLAGSASMSCYSSARASRCLQGFEIGLELRCPVDRSRDGGDLGQAVPALDARLWRGRALISRR
jgi:hypothetical protein